MRIFLAVAAVFLAMPALAQGPFASFDRASAAVLGDPHDLTFGPDGRLYVADRSGNRIVVLDPDTLEIVQTFGDGQMVGARDISFGPDGRAYVAVTGANAVAVWLLTGAEPVLEYAMTTFARTEGVLAHSNGRVYVMASGSGHLVAMQAGKAAAIVQGLPGAHDVAEAADGTIWVADTGARRLVHLTPDLDVIGILDDAAFGFLGPRYLDIDDFGRLIVADKDSHRLLMIDPVTGELLGALGDGSPGPGPDRFDDPDGVAMRGTSYFFSDGGNNRVVRYEVVTN